MRAAALACCLLALPALPAGAAARFAVIAGNNRGATGRAQLWFAERDAERFARALHELGDFADDHVTVLRGATASELRAALAATEAQMALGRARGERALFVVYFSGHAGSAGLELADEHVGYDEIRAALQRSSADTKVAIVDACEAGELTQVKGARPSVAVDFALPADELVQGTALIASTAVGESAQESAAIGGSFFTHHLEVALRGAGDADGDGRVTLAEAFHYTAARTLAGTASTQAGPQHPTYDFKMSGRGDIVLADLRRARSRLKLPPDQGATWVVRGPRELLAEVPASATGTTLALPAGRYTIERRGDDALASTTLRLEEGETLSLPPLRPTTYELARAKGGARPTLFFAGGGFATHSLPGVGLLPVLRVGARQEVGSLGLRLRLDYARKSATDLTLRYSFSSLSAGAALLAPVSLGPVLLEVGPEAALGLALQQVDSGKSYSAPELGASLVSMASMRTGPVRLGLDLGAGLRAFRLDGSLTVRPAATAAFVVFYGL